MRAPTARASKGVWGHVALPQEIFKATPSEMPFSAFFCEIFLQNLNSCKCKKAVFLVLLTFSIPTTRARNTGTK